LKGPFLYSVLFKKGKKGYRTKGTAIYRDIIFRYALLVKKEGQPTSRGFKDYELADWLLDNNKDFKDLYSKRPDWHTKKNSRKKNTIRKIQGKVDDLIKLGLMRRAGTVKQSKGTGSVFLYEFTQHTYFFLALLRSVGDESADEEVYNIYQTILTDKNAPSIFTFYSHLFKKIKERGLFSELIIYPLTEAFFTNKTYSHIMELIYAERELDDQKIIIWNSLQSETLKELDKDTRDRVLLILRDKIQQNIVSKVRSLKDYEEALIRSKESTQTLAVESYCEGCNTNVCALVDIMEYLDAISFPMDESIRRICPTCSNNTLIIPKIPP
jgi:hypothetical protein